jgi:CheY-like chemotaxis protein
MNILVVDDNATGRKLLRAVLEPEGHRVIEAPDGREALALLERQPVEAIFSDLLMPKLDGYRLCWEVRRNERWRNLPFIVYTANYTSPGDERLVFELGADAYLRKPASTTALLEALRAVTQRAARSRPKVSHTEMEALNEYSQRLLLKLEQKNLELEQKSRLAELAAEVGVALTRRDPLRAILQSCVESMVERLDAALAGVWTLNESEQALELLASAGVAAGEGGLASPVPAGRSIVGRIAQERRPYLTNAALSDPRVSELAWVRREGVMAFAAYPLAIEERLLGVLAIFARQELSAVAHAALAALAGSLALGIQNKRAAQVLRESEAGLRNRLKTSMKPCG